MLKVKKLGETEWGALNQYVHEGGGLVVAPGQGCEPESYNNSIAGQLLPAQLADQPKSAAAGATFGKVSNITHPLFQKYGKDLDTVLALIPVFRYWPVKQQVQGSHVLLTYSDGLQRSSSVPSKVRRQAAYCSGPPLLHAGPRSAAPWRPT